MRVSVASISESNLVGDLLRTNLTTSVGINSLDKNFNTRERLVQFSRHILKRICLVDDSRR